MSTNQVYYLNGRPVKFLAENYGIAEFERQWAKPGEVIMASDNDIVFETTELMAPKDLASHHRSCALRTGAHVGAQECTC